VDLFWKPAEGPRVAVPPTLVFAGGFLSAAAWELFAPWPALRTASLAEAIGIVLLVIGVGLFVSGLLTFAAARTGIMFQSPATRLVTDGPYRWSRNPQYVAFLACYLGASFLSNSLWPIVALPFVILVTNRLVIAREERYMLSRFSRDYEAYCRRVPRWL
jgi:protein-S-isoprenylcysteine O-methyltransferase Ste14